MYTGSADSTVKCWVREYGDCTRTYKQSNAEASVVCVTFKGGVGECGGVWWCVVCVMVCVVVCGGGVWWWGVVMCVVWVLCGVCQGWWCM